MTSTLLQRFRWLINPRWMAAVAMASLTACSALPTQAQPAADQPYADRDDVRQFASEVAAKYQWRESWVQKTLAQARYQPAVAKLIMPATASPTRDWSAYRARMVEPVRLRSGLAFWRANARWLDLAEQRYGVPAHIVMGILGVETLYGQHTGNFKVIDALATLSFDFPTGRSDRSPYFRSELEALLMLARQQGVDPLNVKGSFAGAMGLPQFMPSSVNKHAIDFDGDGRIDLLGSPADAVGSVANYLSAYGWQREWPAYFEVTPPTDPEALSTLLGPDIVPLFSPQEFTDKGARLAPAGKDHPSKLALVLLQNGTGAPTYVAGTSNFYAITRYNASSYYAMAVIALGEALRDARTAQMQAQAQVPTP